MTEHILAQQPDRTIEEVREIITEAMRISKKSINSVEERLPQLENLKARAARNSFISNEDRKKLDDLDNKTHRFLEKEKMVFSALQRLSDHTELINQNIEDQGDKHTAFGHIVYLVASTISLSLYD